MDATITHMFSFTGEDDQGPPRNICRSVASESTRLSVASAPERLYSVDNCSNIMQSAPSIVTFASLDPNLLVPSRIQTMMPTPVLDTPFSIPASPQVSSNSLSATPSSLYIGHEFDSMVEDETPEACSLARVASEVQGPMASFKNINASWLLAHTDLHRAPIMYDVMLAPSTRSVVDRLTRSAVPPSLLNQPATDPPIPVGGCFVLQSYNFPWEIVVTASIRHSFSSCHSPDSADSTLRRRRVAMVGLTIFPPSHCPSTSGGSTITILDVLYAVHTTLMVPITLEEWEALGNAGSKAQRKVMRAYSRRCTRMGGGWEGGMLRMDWLGQKTILAGVEVDKAAAPDDEGKLVFAKP